MFDGVPKIGARFELPEKLGVRRTHARKHARTHRHTLETVKSISAARVRLVATAWLWLVCSCECSFLTICTCTVRIFFFVLFCFVFFVSSVSPREQKGFGSSEGTAHGEAQERPLGGRTGEAQKVGRGDRECNTSTANSTCWHMPIR